ncbi:MAG TPA: alpha/beta hydrolase [Syntrophorhabdaceae bacterium]|nr:alpha/beta hydrolase [Syntrophorhabdaceae bacterium]
MPDYAVVDNPSVLAYVFYPREDFSPCPAFAFDRFVTVAEDVLIHCRFYKGEAGWPWILYFHGNGEVVSDYDEISPFFFKYKMNLVVADYRGYGKSGGSPTLTDISLDAHKIYDAVREELDKRGYQADPWIMGRSLGSISALEIAYRRGQAIRGLIIESGFPSIVRLLVHLDVPVGGIDLDKIDRECLEMIREIATPVLIIHGEYDTLVPPEEAEALAEHIGSTDKEVLIIPGATHNDIMFVGLKQYFEVIRKFVERTKTMPAPPA